MALLCAMSKGLDDLTDDVEIQLSRTEIPIFNTSASDELENTVLGLSDLLDDFNNQLVWIERKGSNADLVYCPKNTKQVIHRLFFDSDVLSALTSATLTTAGQNELEEQYSYFIDSTGFPIEDGVLLSAPKPSPCQEVATAATVPAGKQNRCLRHPDRLRVYIFLIFLHQCPGKLLELLGTIRVLKLKHCILF